MSDISLAQARKGFRGRILSIEAGFEGRSDAARRLQELGLLEGASVEVIHEAPFGADPLAVKVRGAMIALRRREAGLVRVRETAVEETP